MTRQRRIFLLIVPGLFFALAGALFFALYRGDASIIPSALIGRSAPAFDLPALEGAGVPGLATDNIKGEVSLVNVWASWCAPCRAEHPVLMRMAEEGSVPIYGLAYKDKPENALGFLMDLGNPFARIGMDESGRAGIDWGIYGVPETFVVDAEGIIRYKHIGPLTPELYEAVLKPEIEKARSPFREGS